MTKKTKNADRNRPQMTTPSCFAPDVMARSAHTTTTRRICAGVYTKFIAPINVKRAAPVRNGEATLGAE